MSVTTTTRRRSWRDQFLYRAERRSKIGGTAIERRSSLMTQLAVLIALVANVGIITSLLWFSEAVPWIPVLVMTGSTVLYGSCLFPLRTGREREGRILFSISLLVTVTTLSVSLGADAGAHALFVPIAMGGAIIWPRSAKGQVLLGAACAVLLLSVELASSRKGVQGLQFSLDTLEALWLFNVLLTAFLCGVVVMLNSGSSIQLQDMLDEERRNAEELLYHVLPTSVANELMQSGQYRPRRMNEVSVVFADIVGFTRMVEQHAPEVILELLNGLFSRFDQLAEAHHTEKIKTIGDAYMVIAGAPVPRDDHLQVSTALAFDMIQAAKEFHLPDGTPLQIRIGIDTGPVMAGIVGESRYIYDVWGSTVNMASRMESHGGAGKIQVTARVRDILSQTHGFESRGETAIKGIGMVETYWLTGQNSTPDVRVASAEAS